MPSISGLATVAALHTVKNEVPKVSMLLHLILINLRVIYLMQK